MYNRIRMLNTQRNTTYEINFIPILKKHLKLKEEEEEEKDNAKALYLESWWPGLVSRPQSPSSLRPLRLNSGPAERAAEDASLPWDLECGRDHDLTIQVHPLHPKTGAPSGLEELWKVTWRAALTLVELPAAASLHGVLTPPRKHSVLSGVVCQGLVSVKGGKRPGKQ